MAYETKNHSSWDETNFLVKGFINEVKGALTESSGGGGGGEVTLKGSFCQTGLVVLGRITDIITEIGIFEEAS